MKRLNLTISLAIVCLVLSGCANCYQLIEFDTTVPGLMGIKVPIKINHIDYPLQYAKYERQSAPLKEAGEAAAMLDNYQFETCRRINKLPKDQRAPLIERVRKDREILKRLASAIQSSPKDFADRLGQFRDEAMRAVEEGK